MKVGVFRNLPGRSNSGMGLLNSSEFILPLLMVSRLLVFMTIVIVRLLVFKIIAELGREEWE